MSRPSPPEPPELTTERLVLHPVTVDDGDCYLPMYSDPETTAHLGGPMNPRQCAEDARRNAERWRRLGFASWLGYPRQDTTRSGEAVVLIGFGERKQDGSVPLGWVVSRRYWRRGVSTEASIAVLDWYFDTFEHKLVTETRPQNVPSQRASATLGFDFYWQDDDNYVCSLVRSDWPRARREALASLSKKLRASH